MVRKTPTTVNPITPFKMQPLKYKINDRVKERTSNKVHGGFVNNQRKHISMKSKRGVIKGVVIKKNRVGADLPHYQVLWDNSTRLTEIQAHRIEHEVA